MSATFFALLIAAASPETTSAPVTEPVPVTAPQPVTAPGPVAVPAPAVVVVADVPGVAEAGWSVGAGASFGGVAAIVERRIIGPVWVGLSFGAGMGSNDSSFLFVQPGSPNVTVGEQSSSWNAGADLRFRLQLVADDAFVRPSLFLGAGIDRVSQTTGSTTIEPGETNITFSNETVFTRTQGELGALLDFTLLPWLAFRASSSVVNAGYQSQTSSSTTEQAGEPTLTNTGLGGGFFAGVQLQPAVSLQAFF